MTIELTAAQQRKIDSYLKRIDTACRGQLNDSRRTGKIAAQGEKKREQQSEERKYNN